MEMISYLPWAGGQPDNHATTGGGPEDCLQLFEKNFDWYSRWNDKSCFLGLIHPNHNTRPLCQLFFDEPMK